MRYCQVFSYFQHVQRYSDVARSSCNDTQTVFITSMQSLRISTLGSTTTTLFKLNRHSCCDNFECSLADF